MAWVQPSTRASGYLVTAANWNQIVNDLLHLNEIGYTETNASVNSSATTVGGAVQICNLGSLTYEAVPTQIEFYAPRVTPDGTTTFFILRDASTVIGTIGDISAANFPQAMYFSTRLTPTAGAHSYNIGMWLAAAGTATVNCGSGGTAGDGSTRLGAWMRASKVPT